MLDLIQTLSDLVSIPSVNPMGRDVSGPEFFEYRVTEYLEKLFGRLGIACQRQRIAPLRDNFIARLDGDPPPNEGGRLVMFEAHQDTVPVDGMTIPPFEPTIRDGRLYGRGSCDIKGGMAAMLAAFARLAEERPRGMPTILMTCTVNEEHGFSGAADLGRLWAPGANSIVPRRPDAAIVAEPTNLNVVVAHKGAQRWRCHTTGRATHSSQPQQGINALYRMGKVLAALDAYNREVCPTLARHRLCGQATLSVGTIKGGISVNTVPDRCTIEIDRRVLPGESGSEAFRQIVEFVSRYQGIDFAVEHEQSFLEGLPLVDGENLPLAEQLTAAARSVVGKSEQIGVPFGTDASRIAALGVPSVVFGPGSIDQAHTADEWLSLEELEKASEVLYRFVGSMAAMNDCCHSGR